MKISMTGAESFRLNAIANGNVPRRLPQGWDLAKVNEARATNGHGPISTLDKEKLTKELFACHRGVVTWSSEKDDILVDGIKFNSWAKSVGRSDNQQKDVAKILTSDGKLCLLNNLGIKRLSECFTDGIVNPDVVAKAIDESSFHIFVNQYRYVDKESAGESTSKEMRSPVAKRRFQLSFSDSDESDDDAKNKKDENKGDKDSNNKAISHVRAIASSSVRRPTSRITGNHIIPPRINKISDEKILVVDLCSGSQNNKIAVSLCYPNGIYVGVDILPDIENGNTDIIADINNVSSSELSERIGSFLFAKYGDDFAGHRMFIMCSPPCNKFSSAPVEPPTLEGYGQAVKTVKACVSFILLVAKTKKYELDGFMIENPASTKINGLHKQWFMTFLERYRKRVSYCQYGFDYRKDTSIWTHSNEVFLTCECVSGHKRGLVRNNIKLFERYKIPTALVARVLASSRPIDPTLIERFELVLKAIDLMDADESPYWCCVSHYDWKKDMCYRTS